MTKKISKIVYQNRWLKVREDKSPKIRSGVFSVIERPNGVSVIPLSPTNKTVLIKELRYPTQKCSWEFPAGSIVKNESPEQAAKRELYEETGLRTTRLIRLAKYYPAPGISPQQATIFVARVSEKNLDQLKTINSDDDIRAHRVLTLKQLLRMTLAGGITDGWTLVAILFLQQSFLHPVIGETDIL